MVFSETTWHEMAEDQRNRQGVIEMSLGKHCISDKEVISQSVTRLKSLPLLSKEIK